MSAGIGLIATEPMILGSPPSPRNPASPHHQHHLPAYLMGDTFHAHRGGTTGGVVGSSSSPSTMNSPSTRTMSSGASSSLHPHSMQSPVTRLPVTQHPAMPASATTSGNRRQAPPTTSLWSTPGHNMPPPQQANRLLASEPPRGHSTPTHLGGLPGAPPVMAQELVFNSPAFGTPQSKLSLPPFVESTPAGVFSPAQTDPFYTQGESLHYDDVLDETWVTVFGYPQGGANSILQQFAQCGTIEKHVIVNEGNWMHLKFQTKLQAKKALSKNGRVFMNGKVMIGVQPCIEKRVMEQNGVVAGVDGMMPPPPSVSKMHLGPTTPGAAAGGPSQLADYSLDASARVNSSMRSLVQSRAGISTLEQSIHGSQNSGILSKAMEYMFGWN